MKDKIMKIWKKTAPFHGVLYFCVILLCSHFFWKFTIKGDEEGQVVTFFGKNISFPFIFMTDHVSNVVMYFLQWFDISPYLDAHTISYSSNNAIEIVWSCTALKQMYIFFCIIAFYMGSWKQKLWYIPAGLFIIYAFNILRITIIAVVVKNHPNAVPFLHEYLLKYLFYGVIFLMWVYWNEKFVRKQAKK